MKKNGFTLIELIGVITVLGVIALIVSAPITKTIKESNIKACESQLDNIIAAAKIWGEENIHSLPSEIDDEMSITIGELKSAGFLDEKIMNPTTKAEFDNRISIMITKTSKRHWKYNLQNKETLCKG